MNPLTPIRSAQSPRSTNLETDRASERPRLRGNGSGHVIGQLNLRLPDWRLRVLSLAIALTALIIPGCFPPTLETSYGTLRGESINGLSVLAEVLRQRGFEVRSTGRLNDVVLDEADLIIRFAPYSGLPDVTETAYYESWLNRTGRTLIYVPHDYDAEADYWRACLQMESRQRQATESESERDRITNRMDRIRYQLATGRLLENERVFPAEEPNEDTLVWFLLEDSATSRTRFESLEGPWAVGVDGEEAALSVLDGLIAREPEEEIFLRSDQTALAIGWEPWDGSEVLILANGSFLLNGAWVNPARRQIGLRLIEHLGPADGRQVVFITGRSPAREPENPSSLWLIQRPPFSWIAAQALAFALGLALFLGFRPGRIRRFASTADRRPVKHAEALGDQLARTGQVSVARDVLDRYRRWRTQALRGFIQSLDEDRANGPEAAVDDADPSRTDREVPNP